MRIGVIGYSGDINSEKILLLKDIAYNLGKEIALRKHILVSGGRDGIMHYVSKGCQESDGISIGVLPYKDLSGSNDYLTFPLTTGLSMDMRSNVMVAGVDGVIMLGGESGTLYELIISYIYQKPTVIIDQTGGWADRIQSVLYEGKYLDTRKLTEIKIENNYKKALDYIEEKF
jgi:uncharacterized protein (TIGR00725 family)